MCDFIIHCTSRFMWKTWHHLPRFNRWLVWTLFTNCSPISMTKWRVSCCGEHFLRADFDFLIKSGQEVKFDLGGNVAWRNWQATPGQQYIEWGMYALQECFPHCMIVSDPRDTREKIHAADKVWYCITLGQIRLAWIRFWICICLHYLKMPTTTYSNQLLD